MECIMEGNDNNLSLARDRRKTKPFTNFKPIKTSLISDTCGSRAGVAFSGGDG